MAFIRGTLFNDTLHGTSTADIIFGLDGNDTIQGGGGADHIDGGTGSDTVVYGDSTAAVLVNLGTGHGVGGTADGDSYVSIENASGSSFNDTLIGDSTNNRLQGLDGNDILNGGGGNDILDGGNGDDILKGGGGADTLIGGAGSDTADYSQDDSFNGISGVGVDLLNNHTFFAAQGDTLSGIENINGTAFDDLLTGDNGANGLHGNDGIDQLLGNGGNDFLDGGNGSDTLNGGAGIDTMIGGAGDDLYFVDNASDVVIETAGQGRDIIQSSVSYALNATNEIEDMMTTDQRSTVALDFSGNDFGQYLMGNEGTNVLQGFGGNDLLDGRGGFDRLFGGDGNDLLFGGSGNDDLFGGAGADAFLYTRTEESGNGVGVEDVIHDFNRAEGDTINVDQMDSDPLVAGTQGWTFTGPTTFTAPGQIGTGNDSVDTFIFFNTDTDPQPEATIRIPGIHDVDASWFVL